MRFPEQQFKPKIDGAVGDRALLAEGRFRRFSGTIMDEMAVPGNRRQAGGKKLSQNTLRCNGGYKMIKRAKIVFKAIKIKNGNRRASGGAKMARKAAIAIFLAALVMVSALISTAQAADRKTRVVSFLSSGLKTAATAQSSAFDVSAYTEGQIFIDVTAEAGTSTLDVIVQTSPDNVTWYTHTTVAQITATGQTRAAVSNFGNYMRIAYTVAGTSMTFSVVGVFKN
jgi:hypothetical protein